MERRPKNEEPVVEEHPTTDHIMVDVGAVSGALTGAVAGVIAGPPGVVVGGAIGAALGTLAGAVLDRETHASDSHDRELDDDIGVTSGDLGAREAARASFEAKAERAEAHRRAIEAELEGKPS